MDTNPGDELSPAAGDSTSDAAHSELVPLSVHEWFKNPVGLVANKDIYFGRRAGLFRGLGSPGWRNWQTQ